MTRTVFLVPRREDGGHRDRLWKACRARWEHLFPDVPIVEGHHTEGPWNRSAALNRAAREAGAWDLAIVIDADVMLDAAQVREAIETAGRTGRGTWAMRGWRELSEQATKSLLHDPTVILGAQGLASAAISPSFEPHIGTRIEPKTGRQVPAATELTNSNCMVIPRAVWEAVGGFDERFEGWGCEDTAFHAAVYGLHGLERVEGVSWNLWHSRSGLQPPITDPQYLMNRRLRDRYAYALRRDYGLHDRGEYPVTDGQREQDMGNIRRSDEKNGRLARELGLPEWSNWWPTLDELLTGEVIPTVALIVHTGGAPEVWSERKEYLRRTLASINERLVLPRWERKVVLSDWGDRVRLELDAIASEAGFYVKDLGRSRDGSGVRLGYSDSMEAEFAYIDMFVKADWVFRAEDDFTFDRDVDIRAMVRAMERSPSLLQMALLRGPNENEKAKPGFILDYPREAFTIKETHVEHQQFFTCNPSLMRRSTFAIVGRDRWDTPARRWPAGQNSEAVYGRRRFASGLKAGLWGQGERWITHIGETRAGGPY